MTVVNKPLWWSKLSGFYGFSNDGLSTIDIDLMLQTLDDSVEGQFARITTSSFQSLMTSVLQGTSSSSQTSTSHFISNNNNAELVLGHAGFDYLAGTTQDNIMHGGLGNDFFSGSAGIDLMIGSDELQGPGERDTVAYLMATSGIYVNATVDTSTQALDLSAGQDVYAFTYADYLDSYFPRVFGFQTGAGGDVIDMSKLLAAVGYTGSNPVGDGYIRFTQSGADIRVLFDADGNGAGAGRELIRLTNTSTVNFSLTHNLVTTSPAVTDEPNYLTYVSNDGQGGYDILYSIENIIGSRFNDTIYGHTIQNNILAGAQGDDALFGEGGADILIGGSGADVVNGGTGNDLILLGLGGDQATGGTGIDTFKVDGTIGVSIAANTHTILDFQTGAGGDKLDVTEVLMNAGYKGTDAVGDGYVQVTQTDADTTIFFDVDGAGGPAAAQALAVLKNTDATQFSTTQNLVTTATQKTLYLSILGQSNAEGLRVLGDDAESGVTRIRTGLQAQTDYTKIDAEFRDENNSVFVPAIGSTRVVGDYGGKTSDSWWYPSTNKPGEILIRAVEIMLTQIADARAHGVVKPVVVWGQGEGDCVYIAAQTTEAGRLAAQTAYKNATLAVFDYIKAQVGADVQFYIMGTGRYNADAALAGGNSAATVARTATGLPYIQAAQEQMALERSDVFYAVNYTDLPLISEYDPVGNATDPWHYHPETREIIGDRIADYIALSLGQDHILDNPGAYPIHLLNDLQLKSHAGMIINGNANNNIVVGTLGDDTLTGGAGNDTLFGGAGLDKAIYTLNFASYNVSVGTYITVAALSGTEGTDTLMQIERIEFADGVYENGVFTPLNYNPSAKDDTFVVEQDTPVSGNVLADNGNGIDSDADGDVLTVVAGVYATANGSVTLNADGTFTYTPNSGFYGIDSFDYVVNDGRGGSDMATVFVTVNQYIAPNNDPVAQDDNFQGNQSNDISGNLLSDNGFGADSDVDGDILSVVAGTVATANGNVTINADGTFVYTPNAGYYGNDSFSYTLRDSRGGLDTATVNLTIHQVNNAPVAVDDAFSGLVNVDVLGNVLSDNGAGADYDVDAQSLIVVAGTFATAHGSVTINTNGTFTYTPSLGYVGADSFTYTVEDGVGGSDVGTVNIVIELPNTAPVAQDDTFSGDENVQISGNLFADNGHGADSDADGNPLTVDAGTFATAHGSVTINADGTFTYTPNAEYVGADSFNYTLRDNKGGSDTATVNLTLNNVNKAPVAKDDAFTGLQNGNIAGNLLADNGAGLDSDPDGDALSIVAGTYATAYGSVTVNTDGSFLYSPVAGYYGADTFDYTLTDGSLTDTGTVNFTVNPLNNAPVAQDDAFTLNEMSSVSGNVLVNNGSGVDSDADGHALSVVAGTYNTANGKVVIAANGNFTYTPNAFFFGSDSYDYTVQDGHGGSDIGRLNFTLNSIEILGTATNNTLNGTTANDIIRGLGGNDTLSGDLGDDYMFGDEGNDTIKGRDGNDIMYGGAGDDYLEGGNGSDILYGGAGNDTLKGSSGADTFMFTSLADGIDIIQDYGRSVGDKIDISALLDMYDPITHLITDFVQIAVSGSNSILSVDVDGGGNSFVAIATILNVTNISDEQSLVSTGHLIV